MQNSKLYFWKDENQVYATSTPFFGQKIGLESISRAEFFISLARAERKARAMVEIQNELDLIRAL